MAEHQVFMELRGKYYSITMVGDWWQQLQTTTFAPSLQQ